MVSFGFLFFVLSFPFLLGDPEMFVEANPIVSPAHIVPEWYFLWAYGILRAIPNKTLGVFFLGLSLLRLALLPLREGYTTPLVLVNKGVVFSFFLTGIMLSWLGQCLVEYPYPLISLLFLCYKLCFYCGGGSLYFCCCLFVTVLLESLMSLRALLNNPRGVRMPYELVILGMHTFVQSPTNYICRVVPHRAVRVSQSLLTR